VSNKSRPPGRRRRDVRARPRRQAPRSGYGALHEIMRAARPIAASRLEAGTVVLARIPYSDVNDYKVRPAVIVNTDDEAATILPCTSALSRHNYERLYHELEDLDSAGLCRPTGVRRSAVRLARTDVLAVRGRLGEADAVAVLPDRPGDAARWPGTAVR
jgi:hypothetical protein